MGLETESNNGGTYLTVVQGKLRQKVEEGTEGAVLREYETSDGEKGSKHELVYGAVSGRLVGLAYSEGKFGEVLAITLDDAGEKFTITLPADSNFAVDFAKKLPNLNLADKVTLRPFDFTNKEGKKIKGLGVIQDGQKLFTYYWDNETKKSLHGIPVAKGDTKKYSKAKWKAHFLAEFIFLQDEVNTFIEANGLDVEAPATVAEDVDLEDGDPF